MKVKILCCNIRYAGANDGRNCWRYRKGICIEVLRAQQPDLLCFQEMWPEQRDDLLGAFPGFDWYGLVDEPLGRNPTNAIFYREESFTLVSSAGYWLSRTPHVPGSRDWQSECIRLANWARLVHRESGKEFRLINTHLDHISQAARENQARLINEDAAAYPLDYPQILAGDMNADARNPAIELFIKDGWQDTYEAVHGTRDPGFTYHEFLGPSYRSSLGKIDWIFVRGRIGARQAQIVREARNGVYPSDHYFVAAEVELL